MKSVFIKIVLILYAIYKKINACFHKIRLGILKQKFKNFGEGADFAMHVLFKGCNCISIGKQSYIDDNSEITAWTNYRGVEYTPQIVIGNNCYIARYNHITAINRIIIGDDALIGKWVTITDNSHGRLVNDQINTPPSLRPIYSKGEVVIGKNVWICDKATITAGVTIGDGCIVAANAVVTKSVPPYSLVAGNPAKVIKTVKKDDNE